MPTTTTQLKQTCDWLRNISQEGQLYSDSREITLSENGDAVFFAYPNDEADGRNYIAHAISSGAKAVVHEEVGFEWNKSWGVPHLAVTNLKKHAGQIAASFYRNPDADMFTVAVTGTNGKTSCTQWLAQALSVRSNKTAVIGTLGVGILKEGTCDKFVANGYTTPDAVLLQRTLSELREEGVSALAIEASSIGLEEERLNGMHVDVALFTNFTRDHLDYHGDMASYEAAKRKLFEWPNLQHAVINLDDEMGATLAHEYQNEMQVIGYTLNHVVQSGAEILSARNIRVRTSGTEFEIDSPFGSARIRTNLVGHFNVSNALGVLGVLIAKGMPWNEAVEAIGKLRPVPGRMEQLGGKEGPMIVIDYAHTPDALGKVLSTLRQVADERKGRLWCVFGCGGDRDQGKRPQMGAVAEAADQVIVTSDNPRNEIPMDIIQQIKSGMKSTPLTIEDRAAAILMAVRQAEKYDVILLAGKGHERWQEVKGTKYPFADADHAALALAARATMKRGGE